MWEGDEQYITVASKLCVEEFIRQEREREYNLRDTWITVCLSVCQSCVSRTSAEPRSVDCTRVTLWLAKLGVETLHDPDLC